MKNKMYQLTSKLSLVLVLLFNIADAFAGAGGWSSSGGDNLNPNDGAAWFNGTKSVTFCIVSSPTFGVSDNDVASTIQSSAQTWREYLKDKQIETQIDTQLKWNSRCIGAEDVVFYLGVSGSASVEAARKNYDNPTAFAVETTFNPTQGWGKGAVWIASSKSLRPDFPNWSLPSALSGIVLHELGHIFGCAHVDGTIMTAKINDLLLEAESGSAQVQKNLSKIDHQRELRICETCAVHFSGQTYFEQGAHETSETIATFARFMGRESVGPIEAFVERPAGNEDDLRRSGFTLTIHDALGSKKFPITLFQGARTETELSGSPLFKVVYPDGSISADYSYSTVDPGQVTASDGTNYFVLVARSVNEVMTIKYVNAGSALYLFSTKN